MLSFIQRYALFMSGVAIIVLTPPCAFATSSGVDTPLGVKTLPLAVEGNEVMTLTDAPANTATLNGSMAIPGATGPLNASALSALVSLLNLPSCTSIAKTGPTTFACGSSSGEGGTLVPYPSTITCGGNNLMMNTFYYAGLSNGTYRFSNSPSGYAGDGGADFTATYNATTGALLNVSPTYPAAFNPGVANNVTITCPASLPPQ